MNYCRYVVAGSGDIALSRWSGICSHRGGAPECVYYRETMASMIVLIGIKGLSDILHRARILSVVTQPKKFPQKSHGHLVKNKMLYTKFFVGVSFLPNSVKDYVKAHI